MSDDKATIIEKRASLARAASKATQAMEERSALDALWLDTHREKENKVSKEYEARMAKLGAAMMSGGLASIAASDRAISTLVHDGEHWEKTERMEPDGRITVTMTKKDAPVGGLVMGKEQFAIYRTDTRSLGEKLEHLRQEGFDSKLINLLNDTIAQYHADISEEHTVTEEKKDPQVEAMKMVAEHMTAQWEVEPPAFVLSAPNSLTVLKEDNNYSKQAHIGGEEFKGLRAYVGKRGAIICVFAPVAVERYTQMEMPYNDCMSAFGGFRAHVTDIGATGKLAVITETKNKMAQKIELEEKSKVYEDFGVF